MILIQEILNLLLHVYAPLIHSSEEEGKLLTKLKAINVIQPSTSDWASAPVLIRKKDGSVHYCIDYCKLTEQIVKTVATLPLISECLDSLAGNLWCSTVDWNSGYYQLGLNPCDRHQTAFITKYGLFEFLCMPFSLCNALNTFQRVVQFIFAGMLWKEVLAYLDDLFILGKGFQHHLINLRKTFCRLKKYNLKLKPRKCILFQTEVPFLGRVVGCKAISVDPDKIKAVQKWPSPRTIKELQSFLGFVNYHRDHIKNFASLTEPLYALTHNRKGKSQILEWNNDLEATFLQVKDALVNAPVLAFPLPKGNFILDTDASNVAVAAELSQFQDGVERVISYGSYSLTPAQRRYCTTRQELLALVRYRATQTLFAGYTFLC